MIKTTYLDTIHEKTYVYLSRPLPLVEGYSKNAFKAVIESALNSLIEAGFN
jgi:hypothetical protein